MHSFNWFDIIVLTIFLLFGLKGIASGMIREIFGILGLIGGFFMAIRYKAEAGIWISNNIYNLNHTNSSLSGTEIIAGFLAILFGIWIICLILGEISSRLLSISGLGFVDKLGGFIFSVAKVFLVFSVIAVMIKTSALLNKQTKPFFEKSVVYPYLLEAGGWIMQSKDGGFNSINNLMPNKIDEKKEDKILDDLEDNNSK